MRFDLNKMDLERVLAKFSACYSDSAPPPQIEKKNRSRASNLYITGSK